jgi:LSD1 subclass zinc finger protein
MAAPAPAAARMLAPAARRFCGMLAAMLLECSHCGAPLDVRDGARIVKCAYCDHANQVRSMTTLAPQPPPGWKPPPQWTPPPHKPVPSHRPLAYHQHRSRRGLFAGLIALFSGLVTVAAVVIPTLPVLRATGQLDHIRNAVGLPAWDGSKPFHCGANDTVVIENVTAVLPDDTAITVEANCDLRITGSTITARRGVRADGNRRVVIEKSRIETTSTAIWADGNKRIELIDTEVTAQELAIRAGGNVEIIASGGRVSGAPPLALTANAEIENQNTELVDLSRKPEPAARPEPAAQTDAQPDKPRRSRRSRRQATEPDPATQTQAAD